ncbi:MAG: CTP synthase [Bacteroidota bacterium]|nr:CTP synthase [Candidatus Kapabacteria bacterium]MDW8219488.1 CTP synthase [Bacteroidota bacterium]
MATKVNKKTKYIFITGGVLSSLGKGITSASLGLLLKERGLTVTIMKFDPYINVDTGTMNPKQHGEVYVTDDGAETDLDLGHYERFIQVPVTRQNSVSTGQIYFEVIQRERQGKYLGKTVQVVPHITDEIKRRMTTFDKKFDVVLIELGGTVGDIESMPFLEAARQLSLELGRANTLFIHLTYVPFIKSAGEFKTKPTQHSVRMLMEYGIQPDILVCRCEEDLEKDIKSKIALFCNVDEDAVVLALDAETIYEVPILYSKAKLDDIVVRKLHIQRTVKPSLTEWGKFVQRIKKPKYCVTIGFVGKYVQHQDAYKSILEALCHAGAVNNTHVEVKYIDSEQITTADAAAYAISGTDGIVVAPGFGARGVEGKILAIQYVREHLVPFFGICLGMQCAVIEFARNVCGLTHANSGEFKKVKHNVIDLMPDQRNITNKGGTMRLGSYPCVLKEGTKAFEAYQSHIIRERHRHRYEFNNDFREELESAGLVISGISPDARLVEIIELPHHPWFLGCQFHPEFKSVAVGGHPLFVSFIHAALAYHERTVHHRVLDNNHLLVRNTEEHAEHIGH